MTETICGYMFLSFHFGPYSAWLGGRALWPILHEYCRSNIAALINSQWGGRWGLW